MRSPATRRSRALGRGLLRLDACPGARARRSRRRAPRGERPSPALRESLAGEVEPEQLTAAQRAAVERIVAALDQGVGDHMLLDGPTGSGKTEVYLQAAPRRLERGSV